MAPSPSSACFRKKFAFQRMPSIDGTPVHLIHEVMSRPIRFIFPAVFLASALSFAGCVGTIYDKTYSYNKTYFKPDLEEKKNEASAETILGALDTKPTGPGNDAAPPPADVPGLPAAGLPAPDAGAMPPAAPPPAAPPQ